MLLKTGSFMCRLVYCTINTNTFAYNIYMNVFTHLILNTFVPFFLIPIIQAIVITCIVTFNIIKSIYLQCCIVNTYINMYKQHLNHLTSSTDSSFFRNKTKSSGFLLFHVLSFNTDTIV